MAQSPVRQQRHRSERVNGASAVPAKDGWDAAVARFLADCRRRNLSPSTLENYEWWLTGPRLSAFRRQHRINSPAALTAEHVRTFESELMDVGLRPSSIDSFHRHVKNFIGYCLRDGMGADAAALDVAGPRLEKQEPETFSADEERRLLAAVKDRPRDRILVELMLRTGLRLHEVANLTVDDVITDDPRGAFLRVRQGKGKKDRAVPLDTIKDRLSPRLRRYIERERPLDGGTGELFLAERLDLRGEPRALTPAAIQTLFKRLEKETGIHCNPHKFRHTFATRALAAGVDVMALQKALGHTTLAMVSRYVHYQKDDLLAAWQHRRD